MTALAHDSGCSGNPMKALKPRTVSVNGVVIARADIARETQNHPAAKPIEAWQAAARALVIRELLLQEARRSSLKPEPLVDDEGRPETDEEALIRQVVDREVVAPKADEDSCRRYWENNRARFRSGDLMEVSHILLAASPKDTKAREEARQQALAIIEKLQDSPHEFSNFAAAYSACPSGKTNGSLGQIGPGQTVPEFERALADLPTGTVAAQPIETRYGFHVVRVDRRVEGVELPYDLVRDSIAAWLDERVQQVAMKQFVSILIGRANIVGVDMMSEHTTKTQ